MLVNRNYILYRYCSKEFELMTSLYYLYRESPSTDEDLISVKV